jgi:hyperosmotically inducible periplasmic protein
MEIPVRGGADLSRGVLARLGYSRRSRKDMGKGRMKLLIAGVIFVSTFAAVPPSVVAAPSAAVKSTADDLEDRIENLIRNDATLKDRDIDVKVDGTVATLTGTVATKGEKDHAAQVAHVKGVTRVDNKIIVDAKKAQADAVDKTKGAVDTAAEKTGSAIGTAGEKTKEGVQKATSETTDAYILTRVKSKFVDEDLLKGSDINVDADNQVVTLKGTVTSEAGRARAVALAKEAEGVKRVVDRLTIAPAK